MSIAFLKKSYPYRGPLFYEKKKYIDSNLLPKNIDPSLNSDILLNTYKQYLFSDYQIVSEMIFRSSKKLEVTVVGLPKNTIELIKKPEDYLIYNFMGKFKYQLKPKELMSEFISPTPSAVKEGKKIADAFLENYVNSEKIPIYTAAEYAEIVNQIDDYNLMVDIIALGIYATAHILYFFL
jgi:hypothetical protein